MSIVYFGVRGFEPPTLASRTRCATTALHPEFSEYKTFIFTQNTIFFALHSKYRKKIGQ